jgi:hypothetical protein
MNNTSLIINIIFFLFFIVALFTVLYVFDVVKFNIFDMNLPFIENFKNKKSKYLN